MAGTSGSGWKEYSSKSEPAGAKLGDAPLLAAGIAVLRICYLLVFHLLIQENLELGEFA
ncbi:MAG: hypothetical protein ABFS17_10545 [Chloroflexota bacterium]